MEPSSNITSYTNSSWAAVTVTGMDLSTAEQRREGQGSHASGSSSLGAAAEPTSSLWS